MPIVPPLPQLHAPLRIWLSRLWHALLYLTLMLLLCALILVILADQLVSDSQQYTYQRSGDIPYNKVAVILGTSKYLMDGRRNEYFANRIEAAADLYRNGKASYFLVSGDNATRSYTEPR